MSSCTNGGFLYLSQPAPAAAQTVTFVTPDGMLVTQTITPLQQTADAANVQPNVQPARAATGAPLQVGVSELMWPSKILL